MTLNPLTGSDAIEALDAAALAPPRRPPQFADGATAELRDAMARFSNAGDHPARRAALVRTIDTIDLVEVGSIATTVMAERLDGSDVDIVAASWHVPSYALATVLGFGDQREQIRADTEQVARVIGRGEPSTAAADEATLRLLARFGDHPEPVAAVSLLYQNLDATSGLVRTSVLAAYSASTSPSAGRTVRVATAPTTIGDTALAVGDEVIIDLAGLPFGSGPHRCPGEALANAVATGVIRALQESHYTFRASMVDVDPNGVPTRFAMAPAN